MNTLYTLLLFCALGLQARAQYIPIPQVGASWLHHWNPSNWMDPEWQQKVFTDGDTVINTMNYAKVREVTEWTDGSLTTSYLAAFRNDNAAQRVYIVPKDSSDEHLLYDFNVEAGDTVKNVFAMCYFNGYMDPYAIQDFLVLSVDSFLMNNLYHRIVKVRGTVNNQSIPVHWFEGFGSHQGLLGAPAIGSVSYFQEWYCSTFEGNHYLNEIDSVIEINNPCPLNLSLQVLDAASFTLHPNPVSESFTIVPASAASYTLQVSNHMGAKVYVQEKIFGEATVHLDDQASGLYSVQIIDAEGKVQHHKLIKL